MSYLLIFIYGYFSVLLLGFQSRFVNHGNYCWAGATSFSIAVSQGMLWSKLLTDNHGMAGYVVYGLSGACAITTAMWTHKRLFVKAV